MVSYIYLDCQLESCNSLSKTTRKLWSESYSNNCPNSIAICMLYNKTKQVIIAHNVAAYILSVSLDVELQDIN